jgi:hypothetical protein
VGVAVETTARDAPTPMHPDRLLPTRRALRGAAVAAVLAVLCACATPQGPSPVERLRALIAAGDLAGADALIAARPQDVDARRALDLAIRGGRLEATLHFVRTAGPDAPLDPDATTPLIRAVVDAPPQARAELVAALRQAGADPARRDRYGRDARDYAATRGSPELLALLQDVPAPRAAVAAPPAFVAWLGAGVDAAAAPAGTHAAAPGAGSRGTAAPGAAARGARAAGGASAPGAGGRGASAPGPASRGAAASGAAVRGAAVAGDAASGPLAPAALLRRSPWRPAIAPAGSGTTQAAVRFHADGTADVLRVAPDAGRPEPLAGSYAAWRIDDGRLRLAMVGDAFAAGCIGGPAPAPGGEPDRLALSCEPLPALAMVAGAAWSQDLARAMLDEIEAPQAPSIAEIASGRAPPEAFGRTVRSALPVALHGSAPGATCRPARARPRAAVPSPRVFGDWLAMDTRRFEAMAPLSGNLCPQPAARDAALKVCRERAGRHAAAACRSVGGCPVGQVSALVGLPGVEAGWVACDPDPGAARRKALDACRADLGCDCQVVALSGRNLMAGAGAGGASCRAPRH